MKTRVRLVISALLALAVCAAQDAARSPYTLGPDDQITIQALEAEEISGKPVRVAADGYVNLPMVGRLKVAGLTIAETEAALSERLKKYIKSPQVAVSLTEERSQPVSVFGSVSKPGVLQLQGRKTLVEVLALAGGLAPEAGHSVKITRRIEWGRVPLPSAKDDETGEFSVAEVELRDIMQAKNPQENILIMPNDVITVPRAQMVYVIGEVQKAGGIVLGDQETMSVLQAMSIAGGVGRTAKPDKAKILRTNPGSTQRTEVAVNLRDMLAGKLADMPMQAEDILFVPNSAGKTLAIRALETGAGTGLSAIIFRSIQ